MIAMGKADLCASGSGFRGVPLSFPGGGNVRVLRGGSKGVFLGVVRGLTMCGPRARGFSMPVGVFSPGCAFGGHYFVSRDGGL